MTSLIFFGAVVALLHYYGLLQLIVASVGRLFELLIGTSAAESFVAVANIFLGPVSIKNKYIV